jgi:DNA invertase Pin-like site-specific DNA recombinase
MRAVARHTAGQGAAVVAAFEEVESGRRSDGPQIALAMAESRLRRCVLLIAKLDRLARDAHFLLGLEKAGVGFVAEEEARATSAPTKAALAAAKARGVQLGNPKLRPGDSNTAADARVFWSSAAEQRTAEVMPYLDAARRAGATTVQGLADALTARGLRRPCGGERWRLWQVRRVPARSGDPIAPRKSSWHEG